MLTKQVLHERKYDPNESWITGVSHGPIQPFLAISDSARLNPAQAHQAKKSARLMQL
jgi:hypothetical protein